MNRPSRRTRAAFAVIRIALLIAVAGLSTTVSSQPESLAGTVREGSSPSEEMIRVGLRYGPSAANEVTISSTSGSLILRLVECSEGIAVPGNTATVRVVADSSRTERIYRLSVGEYSDPLGAEKRLAELAARLGRPVARAVGAAGGYYVAYIGRSPDAEEMNELRKELGLASLDAEIDASDLPCGIALELTCGDGSAPVQTRGGRVVLASDMPGGAIFVGSPPVGYRGSIEVLLSPEGMLEVVNEIALDDYLRSAVGSEMSSYASLEALKAQAVLMRTYAINHMAAPKHDGFHVCDTHHCQAYRGVSSESNRVDAAVDATSDEVLGSSSSVPVQVYYHATCGGLTENSADVWGSRIPHLVSTLCLNSPEFLTIDLSSEAATAAFIESQRDDYCCDASNYRWERRLSEADLLEIARGPGTAGARKTTASDGVAGGSTCEGTETCDTERPALNAASVSVLRRTPAGRVAELEITAGGQRVVLSGDLQIRAALGTAGLLPSCFFVVKPASQGSGAPGSPLYVLVGAGYGHGVGMCQAGAIGMARRGYDYRQILAHYFPGVDVMSR